MTGVTPDTLRFYERRGLIEAPTRTPGRFRVYDSAAIDRVRFIKRAQALGFSLDEIHELIGFNGKGGLRRCARVRDLLETRLGKLEATLAELGALRDALRQALRKCEQALEAADAPACPVIQFETNVRRNRG